MRARRNGSVVKPLYICQEDLSNAIVESDTAPEVEKTIVLRLVPLSRSHEFEFVLPRDTEILTDLNNIR